MPNIEMAAENARSREKTGLPPLEGDEDLVDYYYIIMHPHTAQGKDRREASGRIFKREAIPRLMARFGEYIPLHDKYLTPEQREKREVIYAEQKEKAAAILRGGPQ